MAGIFDKVSAFARSPQGKKLIKQAQDATKDPKNRAKIQELGNKLKDAAKQGGGQSKATAKPDDGASPGAQPGAEPGGPTPDPNAPKP